MSEAWTDRLRRQLDFAAPRIEGWSSIGKAFIAGQESVTQTATTPMSEKPAKPVEAKPVGKLAEAASLFKAEKQANAKLADKFVEDWQKVRALRAEVEQFGAAVILQEKKEIDAFSAEVRQLGNLSDAIKGE